MSEETNLFDPENFESTSPLNGLRGVVREMLVVRHNYGGRSTAEVTAIRVTVETPSLEKPRVNLYSLSPDTLRPSEDRKTPAIAGPFIVGAKIDPKCNGSMFLNALKASGFPMAKLQAEGTEAVNGAIFAWASKERTLVDGKTKEKTIRAYDVPATFEGFEGEAEEQSAEAGALQEIVRSAVLQALETTPEITRGQLNTTVGPLLKDVANRPQALALLLQDSFLSSIPGVTYDKKTIKKG